jgi:hypothetical protein
LELLLAVAPLLLWAVTLLKALCWVPLVAVLALDLALLLVLVGLLGLLVPQVLSVVVCRLQVQGRLLGLVQGRLQGRVLLLLLGLFLLLVGLVLVQQVLVQAQGLSQQHLHR